MNQDQVLEKVTKLLTLANDKPGEAECETALLMAQRLMVKYNISEDMLIGDNEPQIKEYIAYHPEMKGYRIDLACVLAPHFRCKPFVRNGYIFFMGIDNDAKICKKAYDYAYKNIKRDATRREEEIRKLYGTAKGVHVAFAAGYIQGIKECLERQSKSLMVVVPDIVEKEFSKRINGNYRGGTKQKRVNAKYYEEGKTKGNELFETKHISD